MELVDSSWDWIAATELPTEIMQHRYSYVK